MRPYELGFILHPQVEQPDVTQAVDKVSQYVAAGGGEVTSVDVWGRRARMSSSRHSLTPLLFKTWNAISSWMKKSCAISCFARTSRIEFYGEEGGDDLCIGIASDIGGVVHYPK
jgi:hypothetical protein